MKALVLIMTAMGISCSAKAAAKVGSFFDLLNHEPEIVVTGKSKKRECADFSGNWKGTCKVKDQTLEESVAIQQKECQLLEVTGHDGKKINLPIGGVMHSSITVPGAPGFTGSGTLTSNWDAEHTSLQVILGKSGKKLEVDRPTRGMMVNQQIKLVDGKLAVDFTVYYHKEKTTGSCEFTKQ